jgi:hypothetical protein
LRFLNREEIRGQHAGAEEAREQVGEQARAVSLSRIECRVGRAKLIGIAADGRRWLGAAGSGMVVHRHRIEAIHMHSQDSHSEDSHPEEKPEAQNPADPLPQAPRESERDAAERIRRIVESWNVVPEGPIRIATIYPGYELPSQPSEKKSD